MSSAWQNGTGNFAGGVDDGLLGRTLRGNARACYSRASASDPDPEIGDVSTRISHRGWAIPAAAIALCGAALAIAALVGRQGPPSGLGAEQQPFLSARSEVAGDANGHRPAPMIPVEPEATPALPLPLLAGARPESGFPEAAVPPPLPSAPQSGPPALPPLGAPQFGPLALPEVVVPQHPLGSLQSGPSPLAAPTPPDGPFGAPATPPGLPHVPPASSLRAPHAPPGFSGVPLASVEGGQDCKDELAKGELPAIADDEFGVSLSAYKALLNVSDKDGDGELTSPEFKELLASMMQEGNWTPREFSASDINQDGKIEDDELNMTAHLLERRFGVQGAKYASLVEFANADNDGRLTISEFRTLMGSLRRESNFTMPCFLLLFPGLGLEPPGSLRPGAHPPPFGPKGGPLGPMPFDFPPVFALSDRDHNGILEGTELEAIVGEQFGVTDTKYKAMFQAADNDGDGGLKPSEVKELLAAMKQEGNWTPREFSDSDKNHNGEIEGDELNMTAGLMEMEFGVGGSKYEALVEDADVDSNGRLNVQEFMTLMGSLKRAGNFTVTAPPGTGLPSSTEPGSGQKKGGLGTTGAWQPLGAW